MKHRAVMTEADGIADPVAKKAKMMESVVYAKNAKVTHHITSSPPPTCLISGNLINRVVVAVVDSFDEDLILFS